MMNVNQTLYIPLYGKALVSKRGILLHDPTAERIWDSEGFALRGKARSKWLAYFMGMRAAVFDDWLAQQLRRAPGAIVLHIGCGMDSRVDRVKAERRLWYDVDFPAVIDERRKYFTQRDDYRMIAADARDAAWLDAVERVDEVVVVMEGVSMYLQRDELIALLTALTERFATVSLLMDCYTVFGARASKYRNPVNEVGVTKLYGIDSPEELARAPRLRFVREHELTPADKIDELEGFERAFFRKVIAGRVATKIYRLYEYRAP